MPFYFCYPSLVFCSGPFPACGERPIRPESEQKYLEGKFGDALEDVSRAMIELANSLPPSQLAVKAYDLYEKFRPEIPPGKKGWGCGFRFQMVKANFPGVAPSYKVI